MRSLTTCCFLIGIYLQIHHRRPVCQHLANRQSPGDFLHALPLGNLRSVSAHARCDKSKDETGTSFSTVPLQVHGSCRHCLLSVWAGFGKASGPASLRLCLAATRPIAKTSKEMLMLPCLGVSSVEYCCIMVTLSICKESEDYQPNSCQVRGNVTAGPWGALINGCQSKVSFPVFFYEYYSSSGANEVFFYF